jgi:alanine racemase
MSRSVLLIDKQALFHNIRSLYQFSGKPIIAVVKSDAYGVGVKYIANLLESLREVEFLAVACVEEGVELRMLGVKKPILVLGGVLRGEGKALVDYKLTPVISHREHLRAVEGLKVPLHIKFDTGR